MNQTGTQRVESIYAATRTVFTAIALLTSALIKQSSGSGATITPELALITIALLVLVEVVIRLVKYSINSSVRLRKLILMNEFFEGMWIDVTEDKTLAIIKITYENNKYSLKGESYNEHGVLLGDWSSVNTWVTKGKLSCYYSGNYDNQVSDFEGRNEFSFVSPNRSIPNRFTGYFMDFADNFRQHRFAGQRIPSEEASNLICPRDVQEYVVTWAQSNQGLLLERKGDSAKLQDESRQGEQ